MDVKKGVFLGLLLFIAAIIPSGFTRCREDEAIIVVTPPGMTVRYITYGAPPYLRTPFAEFHWHLPWPLEITHSVSLKSHQYEVAVPVLFSVAPNYYIIMTGEGFEYAHAYDLSDLDMMILHLKGEFQITNLTAWAEGDRYGQGDEVIENYLSTAINDYIGIRISEIYTDLRGRNPDLSEEELWTSLNQEISETPSLLVYGFETYQFKELIEGWTGIKLHGEMQVIILEEPLSDYL